MAGALFAAEVLYRDLDLEYEVLIPSVISSIIAYAVFALRFGWDPLFLTPPFVFENPVQLVPFTVLAVGVAAGAYLYIRSFYGVRDFFHASRIPVWLRPAVGGLVVGAIGLFLPEALATGYGIIQRALVVGTAREAEFGTIGVGLLLAVFVGKILTTSFSIGSGGSGGVFGPAVVIGGALGGAIGIAVQTLFPGSGVQPGAFVIVGMAGFFAAAANTPISTIIMVSEMTGNYHLLVPSMWVCVIGYLLVSRVSLYENQLKNRFEAPVHMGNMLDAVLRNILVRDVIARQPREPLFSVGVTATLGEMMRDFARLPQSSLPVLDEDGSLLGIVRARELRALVEEGGGFDRLIIAEDIMAAPVTVREEDSLLDAVRGMASQRVDEVFVVDRADPRRVCSMVTHYAIVSAYHASLAERQES
jgi:CIC family chloride channel protein